MNATRVMVTKIGVDIATSIFPRAEERKGRPKGRSVSCVEAIDVNETLPSPTAHGSSASARRGSTSSASTNARGGPGQGSSGADGDAARRSVSQHLNPNGRVSTRRSPSTKQASDAASPPRKSTATVPTLSPPPAILDDKTFNPLVAMQTVIAGDLVPIKQRSKAAQQLATYFCELPTTPSLYAYYDPYLPILANVVVVPIRVAKEVQENAIKMLKALASHSPRQFVDWCALHVSMDPTQEPWYVDWCCGLLLAAETRVPRRPLLDGECNGVTVHDVDGAVVWDTRSVEYQELEAATAAVFHVWRSVVDNADDEDTVYEIAVGMKTLLCYQSTASEHTWRALVTSKIQPHFVDVTDVLIGWAMSTSTSKRLREAIFGLLEEMRELWIGNNVFCLQLLESFSNDIGSIYASTASNAEDFGRLDSIILCSTLVAQFIPVSALSTRSGQLGFVETILRSSNPDRIVYSCNTLLRLSEHFDLLAKAQRDRFALLNMSAIRFLSTQLAHQIVSRQCDMRSALCILEKASGLAKMLSAHHSDVDARLQAKSFLADVVVRGDDQTGSLVLEVLLSLKYFATVKYSTQIVIKTAVFVGVEGLQLLAAVLEEKLFASGDSFISFWVTCFILVCKDPQLSHPAEDNPAAMKALKILLSITRRTLTSTQPRHAEVVIRLVVVFAAIVRKWDVPELNPPVSEVILAQVQLTISMLRAHSSNPASVRDLLGSLAWGILSYPPDEALPLAEQKAIVRHLQLLRAQDTALLRTECINLLVAIAPRVMDPAVSVHVLMMASELMDECEDSQRITLATKVFPCLPSAALVTLNDQHLPTAKSKALAWRNIWVPSVMLVGDFERVYELLTHPETGSGVWYRTCRQIDARIRRAQRDSVHDRSTLIKSTVREAAKWVVQNRLRSPLGPPSAIFSGVEKMVQTHANHHIVRRRVADFGIQDTVSAMMLVEFVVAMEALLNAATDLICPDSNPDSDAQKIQGFIRANVGVCDEWLSRIRPTLVELSACLKQSEAFMHHSHAAVRTLARKLEAHVLRHPGAAQGDEAHVRVMKSTIDLEGSVFVYARSLCELGDSDTILGLRVWWGDLLSRLINIQGPSAEGWEQRLMLSNASSLWLQALALQAELKYEDAVKCYESILTRTMQCQLPPQASPELLLHALLSPIGLSLNTFVGCMRECGRCLATLRRWGHLKELSTRCQEFALSLSARWGRIPSLAGLVELCEAWTIEAPFASSLRRLEDLSDESSHVGTTLEMGAKIGGVRASAVLEKWGALSTADYSGAVVTSQQDYRINLDDVNRVAERFRALLFRPDNSFSDTLSSTTMRVRESALLVASVVTGKSADDRGLLLRRLQLVTGHGNEYLFDPTQWARLYKGPSHRDQNHVPSEWWLALARAARKQRNYVFAESMLNNLQDPVSVGSETSGLAVLYEKAILKMTSDSCRDGVLTLVKLCESVLQFKNNCQASTSPDTVHVRALLRLARTLASVATGDEFGSIEAAMGVMGSRIEKSANKGLVEYRDNLVMVCLESATQVAPTNPQTWYEFSKWCHQQGRQILDKVVRDGGLIELLPSEEQQLQFLLKALQMKESVTETVDIRDIFRRVMHGGSLLSNREERLRRALSGIDTTSDQAFVDQIVSLQSRVVSRLLSPIKNAATGYNSFLLTANMQTDSVSSRRDNSRITSVALRLLRMLTRFGSESEVVDTVTDVFTSGPLAPWGRIVPQLLSRIGHSYSDVSNPVAALLVRLARRYPHLVVYPAVVEAGRKQDAQHGSGKKLLSDVLSELHSCAPDLTEGVGRMVDELKRISILWDDAWIWALAKMSGDVKRRISTLEKEAHRVEMNSSLSALEKVQLARRKAVAIMTPVLVAIERLGIDTVGRAMPGSILTPHEKQFVHKYGSLISKAIQVFRGYCGVAPPTTDDPVQLETSQATGSALTPSEVWQPFSDLLKALIAAVGRRERIDLVEISPNLARTSHKSKAALMPGTFSAASFHASATEMITVSEVSRSVAILRTKTKPKCLNFVGSDGQSHRYLLKAREDLHLDERIMQFLETVNEFLRADRASSARNLRARHYSVVPLSSDAGLIQIVPDVLPLFQIYTSRVEDCGEGGIMPGPAAADQDEATLPLQKPPTAPFYAKLKQYGIHDVAPSQRSRWPLAILRRVHEDLVSARPANVIDREIAVQSADFADAWAKKYRFSRSTAVMSVLGYLVGLGDRHLDNMLLCAATGELLHIDYNVCFDKGRKLKVPEIVPFRLTPIMVDALGLSGVEGVYRNAFVNTLRVVRDSDSREALLALLDAFVYDPLVDWVADGTTHAISRDSKQRMDVNVNLSLFLSRARERSRETAWFLANFKSSSTTVGYALEQAVGVIDRKIITQCQQLTHAKEIKKHTDDAVRQKEREWIELSATDPEEEATMKSVLGQLEGAKSRITSFLNQCNERHQHVKQMHLRLSTYVPGPAVEFMSRAPVGSSLALTRARIVSFAMQSPTPSSSVWMNMLNSLEVRCFVLDQQISAAVEKCDRIVNSVAPVVQEYMAHRSGELARLRERSQSDTNVGDVYGVWGRWCTELAGALDRSDYAEAHDIARSIVRRLDNSLTDDCSRLRHTMLATELEREVNRLSWPSDVERTSSAMREEMDTLVQEFVINLSALKLSNSQTHRMVKFISSRWMLSSLRRLQEATAEAAADHIHPESSSQGISLVRSVHTLSYVTSLLRNLALTAKGSMTKTIADMIASESRIRGPENDWVLSALESIRTVTGTLESISTDCMDTLICRQYGTNAGPLNGDHSPRGSRVDGLVTSDRVSTNVVDKLLSELPAQVRTMVAACNQLGEGVDLPAGIDTFRAKVDEVMKHCGVRPSKQDVMTVAGQISAATAILCFQDVMPLLEKLLRHIVCNEWNLHADIFDRDQSYIDTLAIEAMPALTACLDTPLTVFHTCCERFESLWSLWSSRSTEVLNFDAKQRRLHTLTTHLEAHKRHIMFQDWSAEEMQGQASRSELLHKISIVAPTLPLLFEDMGLVESNLLEVAQQLEYVATQISFGSTMGMPATEDESQAICRELQDLYNQTSRRFEVTRDISEVALGVNTVETSLRRICSDTTPSSLEVQMNQVGRNLLEEILILSDQLTNNSGQKTGSAMATLKERLEEARQSAKQATADVATRQEELVESCRSLDSPRVAAQVTEAVEQLRQMNEVMRSLGIPDGLDGVDEEQSALPKDTATTPRRKDPSKFALAENERLVKILHRSVESVVSMQDINNVLTQHSQKYHQLQLEASSINKALSIFCASAQAALEKQDMPRCIMAVEEVVRAYEEGGGRQGARDVMSELTSLLEQCCQRFYDAAKLADELTMADDLAPSFDGANGQPGHGSEENAEEQLNLSDEDLADPGDVPLRPLAGFQEQNRYGVDVVARIDEKLGGVVVESGSHEQLSIEDQSSWLIRAATNVDNLCVMYEGWTPWI